MVEATQAYHPKVFNSIRCLTEYYAREEAKHQRREGFGLSPEGHRHHGPPLAGHAAAGVRGSREGVSNRQESSGRPRLAVVTQVADLTRDEARRIAATITKLPQCGDASS